MGCLPQFARPKTEQSTRRLLNDGVLPCACVDAGAWRCVLVVSAFSPPVIEASRLRMPLPIWTELKRKVLRARPWTQFLPSVAFLMSVGC
jgi:hypothetical protein